MGDQTQIIGGCRRCRPSGRIRHRQNRAHSDDQLRLGSTYPAAAQTAAETLAAATATAFNARNDRLGGSRVDSVEVTCTTTDGDVRVSVANSEEVKTFFAGLLGVNSTHPARAATARVYSPSASPGLRPIAACAADIAARYDPQATPIRREPFLVFMDHDDVGLTGECEKSATGDWNILNFEEQGLYGFFDDPACPGGGSAQCQAAWTLDGFPLGVYFQNPAAYTSTSAARTDPSDPGIGASGGIAGGSAFITALESLPGKTVSIPVVDWFSGDKVAGTNVGDRFGLTSVVSVEVCAVRYGKGPDVKVANPAPGVCAGRLTPSATTATMFADDKAWWEGEPSKKRYALWVVPIEYAPSSPVGGPRGPSCPAWNPDCNFGTLGLQLFE